MPWPRTPSLRHPTPAIAQTKQEEGPKTYDNHDFSWTEDWLACWRAVALLGGLVFVEGLALWVTLTTNYNPHFAGGGLFGLALLVGVCGIPASFLGASGVSHGSCGGDWGGRGVFQPPDRNPCRRLAVRRSRVVRSGLGRRARPSGRRRHPSRARHRRIGDDLPHPLQRGVVSPPPPRTRLAPGASVLVSSSDLT